MIDLTGFSVEEYLQEAGISYSTSGKNVSENWIGLSCPFCGDSSNHCGINIHTKAFSCFRCGEKGRITKLIMALENKDSSGALNTVKKFLKKEKYGSNTTRNKSIPGASMVAAFISENATILCQRDGDYLERRGFDYKSIEQSYGILSCKPTSKYAHRILIPYIFQGKQYTFSTRDTSRLAKVPYLHCPISKSIAAPKELLYNVDTVKDTCLVVEGCFDVFRMGPGTVALSGIQFTRAQVLGLSRFKKIFILFDPEEVAQEQACRLANDLSFCAGTVEILKLDVDCDPGDMKEDDVKVLRREVFSRIY